jgi:hypothetical protein
MIRNTVKSRGSSFQQQNLTRQQRPLCFPNCMSMRSAGAFSVGASGPEGAAHCKRPNPVALTTGRDLPQRRLDRGANDHDHPIPNCACRMSVLQPGEHLPRRPRKDGAASYIAGPVVCQPTLYSPA